MALYNRLENGILKTWSIDNEPPGFKREDHPQGHICYDMTISHHGPTNIEAVVLNDLEGLEWETLDSNVRQYGLKSYLGFPVLVEGQVVGSLCVVDTRKRRGTRMWSSTSSPPFPRPSAWRRNGSSPRIAWPRPSPT